MAAAAKRWLLISAASLSCQASPSFVHTACSVCLESPGPAFVMNSYSSFKTQFWHVFYCVVALTSLNRLEHYTSLFRFNKLPEARGQRDRACGWCRWRVPRYDANLGEAEWSYKKTRDSVLWHVLSGEATLKIGNFFDILYPEHLVPPLPPYGHMQNASTQTFTPWQNTQGFLLT